MPQRSCYGRIERMKRLFTLLTVAAMALFVVGCSENGGADDPNDNGSENNGGNSGGDNDDDQPIDIPYEELPYFCDVENLAGWSNARICKDGNAIFTSQDAATRQVEKTLMFVKADTLGFVAVYGEFDETGFPKSLAFDDAVILIDNHTETTFGATLFVEGEAVWTAAELELPAQASRAWNDNNWVRNTCAIGGVITSSIGIGIGVALTGTGLGTMTGLVTIASSCGALTENLGVLFGPAEEGGGLSAEVEQYIQDKGWDNLCDGLTEHEEKFLNRWFSEHMDALDRLSWVDLALDLIDRTWGKTVTESDRRLALILAHRSYVIETGVAKDVTEHTAELWGYVSPEALAPLGNYAEIEYGIVVYPTADPSNRMHKEYIVGDGGAFSLLFRGLEYDTEYSYFVYYNDKTNALPRYGQTRTFKTVGEDDIREMLIKFYHDTGGDNWTHNDNWCSDRPINEWYGVKIHSHGSDGVITFLLHLERNNLTGSGDLSGWTALEYLICSNNQLTSLNVSGCTALEELYCDGNQLTSLNVSGCTALKELYCYFNQLTSLNVSGSTALKQLYCSINQLTLLNVSGCTALKSLSCSNNHLTSLDVSGCTSLTDLWCYYNQLTSLNVSDCAALRMFDCCNNKLTSLDVSGCTALTHLDCRSNQLTSLNVSGCTAMEHLHCTHNPITQQITEFYQSLPCFDRDKQYTYGEERINGKWVDVWYYRYDDHHGWYYPDEPYSGYVYGGVYDGN